MNLVLANAITGGLSKTTKMPCMSYGFPAKTCKRGAELRKICGSVCEKCYALRGHYTIPDIEDVYKRRYDLCYMLHNDGKDNLWIEAITYLINAYDLKHFRWFDSGDLQGTWMLDNIFNVVRNTPNVNHWMPTKEQFIIEEYFNSGKSKPRNIIIRISADMIDGDLPIEFAKYHGINVSGVSRTDYNCPSSKQGNMCLDCRNCWNPDIMSVIYKYH